LGALIFLAAIVRRVETVEEHDRVAAATLAGCGGSWSRRARLFCVETGIVRLAATMTEADRYGADGLPG
jgi:hypothetical protein